MSNHVLYNEIKKVAGLDQLLRGGKMAKKEEQEKKEEQKNEPRAYIQVPGGPPRPVDEVSKFWWWGMKPKKKET